jgi:hypothetical protein
MKEKMEEAKLIYYEKEFRHLMRSMQGFTDEDFNDSVTVGMSAIKEASGTDVYEIFERCIEKIKESWKKEKFPAHADWHHYIVPGAVLVALRNAGYPISDKDIKEGIRRGVNFPGGSCGFAGLCGGAYSAGIVLSIIKKTNPISTKERREIMLSVIDTLNEISKYPARCCKRSSYIALQKITEYLKSMGYINIICSEIKCKWSKYNTMCMRKSCPYFDKESQIEDN